MSLEVLTGFDGSCPHFKRGVKKDAKGNFTLYPSVRSGKGITEEAVGGGSRFYTRIRNKGNRTIKTVVTVDWQGTSRTQHHDLGYVRHEGDHEWVMIPGTREGAIVKYRLVLKPGVTELGLFPAYNYTTCREFVERLKAERVKVEVIGKSRDKRDIWQMVFPSTNPKAGTFFIQARDHPYETAGSYCVEGIVVFLRSGDPLAAYLRDKFRVVIVPMTNVDGVYRGMSRLVWERGANMNRLHTEKDSSHDALKSAIDKAKPIAHMNIHNWTQKFMDGLLANEQNIMDRILQHLPADREHYKRWFLQTHMDYLKANNLFVCPEEGKSWKNYVREKFDAAGVTFEFPWFMRNTADMRALGGQAFIAQALAVIEEKNL